MRSRRWYLAALVVTGLTLQCDSEPSAPDPGIPLFATHPDLSDDDSVNLGGMPFAAAISPTNVVYVTRATADSVARTVLPNITFPTQFPIGDLPSQVRISPNGQTAYVSNQGTGGGGGTSTVRFVNVSSNTVFDTVTVPGSVLTIGLSPNGTKLYALTDFRGVYILDALAGTLIDSIPPAKTDSLLTGVAFHPFLLRMYITARDKGKVITINTNTNDTVSTTLVGSSGRLQNVAVSRDGAKLYATDIQRSKLITWTLSSGTPVSPSETSIGTATNNNVFDVAVTPDNVQVYVTTLVNGKVYVRDRATLAAIDSIRTSGKPRYIAFNYLGDFAVIPNENGWVDVIH